MGLEEQHRKVVKLKPTFGVRFVTLGRFRKALVSSPSCLLVSPLERFFSTIFTGRRRRECPQTEQRWISPDAGLDLTSPQKRQSRNQRKTHLDSRTKRLEDCDAGAARICDGVVPYDTLVRGPVEHDAVRLAVPHDVVLD